MPSPLRGLFVALLIAAAVIVIALLLLDREELPPPIVGGTDPAGRAGSLTTEIEPVNEESHDAGPPVRSTWRGRWTGTVVDGVTGAPVAGAVLIVAGGWGAFADPIARTRSDGEGRFEIELGRADLARVTRLAVRHPDYVAREIDSRGGFPEVIELFPGVSITGEVQIPEGTPVRTGGEVFVLDGLAVHTRSSVAMLEGLDLTHRYQAERTAPVPIDAGGRFRVTVGSTEVGFQARCLGYAPVGSELVTVEPGRSEHVILRLRAEHVLRGRVADPEGRGLAGATVRVTALAEQVDPDRYYGMVGSTTTWETSTASDGAFAIGGLASMYAQLHVEHSESRPFRRQEPAATDDPVEVILEPGQWLTGRVIIADGTVPR